MNRLHSFHTPSNFISKTFVFLRTLQIPNPSHQSVYSRRRFSDELRPSITGIITCNQSELPPRDPISNCDGISTICELLTNPSVSVGPALEAALDQTGINLDASMLQKILDRLRLSPKIAFTLFFWAERQPGYLSSVGIFNAMIKLLARAREFESALCLILDRLKRQVEGPDMDTFSILIRRYARAGTPSPAISSLEFACSLNLMHGSNSELNLFEILVDSFCKEGLVLEASEYFTKKRARDSSWIPSIHVCNILLNGWFCLRQLQQINRLLDAMEKDKVKRNIVTYGILVEGFCWMSHVEMAIELVAQMEKEGIEPNEVVYNPIIDALGKMGRFKEALGMMERFLVLESGPTFSTYNCLVKSFCKAGDIEGANKILKMMIGRGFMPTTTTYKYLFTYFSNAGKTDEGLSLYTKMIESGYTPDRFTCLILVKLFCKRERLELAMQVRKEMKARGHNLDLTAYVMLVHLLCDMNRFKEAFEELEDMIHGGIVPEYATCQKMLDGLKKQGMVDLAKNLSRMVASVPQLTRLRNAYCEDVDISRARRRSIMQKAKAMSDTLKICRDPRELVKRSNRKSFKE